MDNTNKSSGAYNNLNNQITSLFQNSRHSVGIKSRYKYLDIERNFASYLADNFKLQKLENVKSKHLVSYTKHLQSLNYSPSTIKTCVSGIRYFHSLTGSKNELLPNSQLNLQAREPSKYYKSWTYAEYKESLAVCSEASRLDIRQAISLSYNFGLRLEECAKCRVQDIKLAYMGGRPGGELWTKGKNGKERLIKVRTPDQVKALEEALQYARDNNIPDHCKLISDEKGVQKTKRSIQNFITANQHKWIDNTRTLEQIERSSGAVTNNKACKIRTPHLSFHGLRSSYCSNLYEDIYKETGDKVKSRLYCSSQLGHGRESVVFCYLESGK